MAISCCGVLITVTVLAVVVIDIMLISKLTVRTKQSIRFIVILL
jgi:hypothetical protein